MKWLWRAFTARFTPSLTTVLILILALEGLSFYLQMTEDHANDGWDANVACMLNERSYVENIARLQDLCRSYCLANYTTDPSGGPCFENCYAKVELDQRTIDAIRGDS